MAALINCTALGNGSGKKLNKTFYSILAIFDSARMNVVTLMKPFITDLLATATLDKK
jgi:hypothetical protein